MSIDGIAPTPQPEVTRFLDSPLPLKHEPSIEDGTTAKSARPDPRRLNPAPVSSLELPAPTTSTRPRQTATQSKTRSQVTEVIRRHRSVVGTINERGIARELAAMIESRPSKAPAVLNALLGARGRERSFSYNDADQVQDEIVRALSPAALAQTWNQFPRPFARIRSGKEIGQVVAASLEIDPEKARTKGEHLFSVIRGDKLEDAARSLIESSTPQLIQEGGLEGRLVFSLVPKREFSAFDSQWNGRLSSTRGKLDAKSLAALVTLKWPEVRATESRTTHALIGKRLAALTSSNPERAAAIMMEMREILGTDIRNIASAYAQSVDPMALTSLPLEALDHGGMRYHTARRNVATYSLTAPLVGGSGSRSATYGVHSDYGLGMVATGFAQALEPGEQGRLVNTVYQQSPEHGRALIAALMKTRIFASESDVEAILEEAPWLSTQQLLEMVDAPSTGKLLARREAER